MKVQIVKIHYGMGFKINVCQKLCKKIKSRISSLKKEVIKMRGTNVSLC